MSDEVVFSSSVLFNVFINDLLADLRECGFGARLAGLRVECIPYADDITLISPTVFGLQSILSLCENLVQKNMLKFNVKKTKVTVFCKKSIIGTVQVFILMASIYM